MDIFDFLSMDRESIIDFDFKKLSHWYYLFAEKYDYNTAMFFLPNEIDIGYNNDDNPIMNWLRYAAVGAYVKNSNVALAGAECLKDKLPIRIFDCDNSNGTSKLVETIYDVLWGDIKHYSGDTINSFWITYKIAMQIYYGYTPVRNLETLKELILHFDEYPLVNELDALKEFALRTHTLGNFMPCPVFKIRDTGYNLYKGNYPRYADYFDLLLCDLKRGGEELTQLREWLELNGEMLFLNVYFENGDMSSIRDSKPVIFFSGHNQFRNKLPKNEEQLQQYLITVNRLIKERSGLMEHHLRSISRKLFDN